MTGLKGLFVYLWLLATSISVAWAQQETVSGDLFSRKWELSIHGGWSYRVAKMSKQVPAELVDYNKRLRSGYHVGAGVDYFWREDMGVGLRYSLFNSKGYMDNVTVKEITTGHSIGRGPVNDDIFLNFIAPAFNYRYIFGNRKAAFQAYYAIGYLSYSNYAMLINERMIISAQNVGMSIGANFVVPLGQRLSFTPGVTLIGSSFGTFKIQRASGMPISIHVDADDGRENVSRLDLSAGLRMRI